MEDHVLDLLPQEITSLLLERKIQKYRIDQLLNWIYPNLKIDPDKMTNLPAGFKNTIQEIFDFSLPQIVREQKAIDGTSKYLLKLSDNNQVEMVIIPNENKNTLCISSQVGCSRGCKFCATATLGLKRNLKVSEIVAQVYLAKRILKEEKLTNKEMDERKLTNIVFMGMGEPLDNLDNVLKAVRILQHEQCFSFSPRRITISTCGVIPGIKKLAESGLKVKLAVSLNSAIQAKREELMPITKLYPLADLKNALLSFRKATAFRITFEYVMIKDFNIGQEDIKALLKYLGDISCKLNVIKWNEVAALPYKMPSNQEVDQFINSMEKLDSAVTYRKSRGAEIAAACGQLAGNY
jgi:23S rRNA (adenine2503-C2)-methyltransferase